MADMWELVQIAIIAIGVLLTVQWLGTAIGNLVALQQSGTNGVKAQQAVERLVTGALLLLLQLLWLTSAIVAHDRHAETAEGQRFETLLSLRGAIGSLFVTSIILWKRYSWHRTRRLFEEYGNGKS